MKRTNVLSFRSRTRRTTQPSRLIPISETTVAGMLRRMGTNHPELGEWIAEYTGPRIDTRSVRCVPVGRDLVVEISPPLKMAKAAIAIEENEQLA